ncbi:MAG TPA: hypothetical protein DF383_14110 [Deltaproteobacteria bacterium]|nr:hypothetical protein [Deltaproteobacteria bacterium]
MKSKLSAILTLALLVTGVSLGGVSSSEAAGIQKRSSSPSTLGAKKCEKCRRGEDGKMICEPVPCP